MIGYIGPGLGGGIAAIIVGVILTFFSFLVAVFWIPLKRLFKFIKNRMQKQKNNN